MVRPIEQRISDDRTNLIIWIDKLQQIVKADDFKDNLHFIEQHCNAVFQFGTVLVEQCRKQQLERLSEKKK